MLKEKFQKAKNFVKEHKSQLLLGAATTISITLVILEEMAKEQCKEIGGRSLDREEKRILFEIKEIEESIERLDKDAPINKFDRIPRKEARINELNLEYEEVQKDKELIKEEFTKIIKSSDLD